METLNFQEAGKYFRKHYINLQSWKQIRCTRGSAKCQGYGTRSEEHTSELQSPSNLVCRLLLEKTKQITAANTREDIVNRILERYGLIDILVNTAGVGLYVPAPKAPMERDRTLFTGNFFVPLSM